LCLATSRCTIGREKRTMRDRLVHSRGGLLLVTSIRRALTPLLAPIYRRNVENSPGFLLTALGIGHVGNRPSFQTIERIINSIDQFPGSVIECGTYRGRTLLGMAHLLRKRGIEAKIYGLDSFQGFPDPTEEDALESRVIPDAAQKGYFGDVSYDELNDRIRQLGFSEQVTLVKGFFENTLPSLSDEVFTLIHLDCDLYQSYKTCLEFLYDRLLPGGYIVFDEYDEPDLAYPGAHRAIDEFFADKPEQIQFFAKGVHDRAFVRKL